MDWFERLTGFQEGPYEETKDRLSVIDGRLQSQATDRSYAVGKLTMPSVAELRKRATEVSLPGRLRLSIAEGDVRAMHSRPENRGALFQVASQFNMLEMVGPQVTPENGVTRYEHDRTQGPACAMAAGAALIYRNYLAPIASETGQTASRQLDGLADMGAALAERVGADIGTLWTMRNGYAMVTADGLKTISDHLITADTDALDSFRSQLRVGLHESVEVTDGTAPGPIVSQVFCSALPVAYSALPASSWASFAKLVLEAAYEATLLAAVMNAASGGTNRVLLTRLGGGAFGNNDDWIDSAILRALQLSGDRDLDVVIVSYGRALSSQHEFVKQAGYA